MMRLINSMLLVASATLVVGCSEKPRENAATTPATPAADSATAEQGHSHGEGPNGGAIADWGGGEYHVEFTVNHDSQEATVYILDSNAESAAPLKAEKLLLTIDEPSFQVDLMPTPLEGEAEGTSSRFVGQHESLGEVREFAGTISGEVEGTPYAGDFAEVAHAD